MKTLTYKANGGACKAVYILPELDPRKPGDARKLQIAHEKLNIRAAYAFGMIDEVFYLKAMRAILEKEAA